MLFSKGDQGWHRYIVISIYYYFPMLQKCDLDAHPQFSVPPGTEPSLTNNGPKPHELATKGNCFGFGLQTPASLSAINKNLQSSTIRSGNHYCPVIDPTLVSPIHNFRSNSAKVQPKVSCPMLPDLSHNDYSSWSTNSASPQQKRQLSDGIPVSWDWDYMLK